MYSVWLKTIESVMIIQLSFKVLMAAFMIQSKQIIFARFYFLKKNWSLIFTFFILQIINKKQKNNILARWHPYRNEAHLCSTALAHSKNPSGNPHKVDPLLCINLEKLWSECDFFLKKIKMWTEFISYKRCDMLSNFFS